MERPRLQRSISERPAPLRRSGSLFGLLSRVPPFRNSAWGIDDCDDYTSSEDEPPAPPSPTISPEEAKRARKQKLQRLFKQGVSKVMKQRAEEMDKMAKLGALYASDAFAGRLKHGMAEMSTKPWYIFSAFRLQISTAWLWCIIACSMAHSMLVFLEPRPGAGGEEGWFSGGTLRALEAIFILVYAIDVALKVAYMGLKNYLKKPWQKLMIGIVLTLAVDASGLFGVRFARPLRPAILSLRTRSIRRFYAVVSNMLPGFLRVCLPVLFFLLLSASFAALSFGRAKSDFEDSMAAGYSIWILMVCADNYGSLVDEPSQHPAYIPFVVMVIIVGSMFLLSLLLGVTYDVFIEHTTEQVKSERLKELKGLNKAFSTMDPEGTGKLSMVVWDRFLLHMMPRTTQQERALYFEIASGFGDDLDVLGFMDLRQVMSYSFVNVNAVERQDKRLRWEKKPRWLVSMLEAMEGTLHMTWWKNVVATVVLLDCLFLPYGIPHQGPHAWITWLTTACGAVLLVDQAFQFAEWMRLGSGTGPLRLPGKSFHTKLAGCAVLVHTAVVALLYCPPLLSLFCSIASFASNLWSSSSSSLLDGGGGGTVGEGLGWCPVEEEGFHPAVGVFDGEGCKDWGGVGGGMCMETDWCLDRILMAAYTLRLLRCWRLVTLNDTLHAHVDTFFSVVPVFVQTLSFALIVAYSFAMAGMQIFGEKASAFKDAGTSLRTTLQLFVGVDFSAVVEDTVSEVGSSAFFFFVLYHVVGVLIVFNLLTAIMIQLYGEALNEKSRQNMEDQRKADQELQDSLYEHNQKQRVLRLWGRNLTQRAAKLNITRGTAVNSGREARRVLGAGTKSQVPTVEELTHCQSYANVDLLRALQDRTRGDNSLRTFERSLYQKLKSSNSESEALIRSFSDGDIIYQRGDQHHCCYFVHKGVVRLEAADGTIETKETGEMFGEESLVVSLVTCATAVADGPVECVGIDRATFTEAHGTLENLGHIFLRLQRSGSLSGMEAPSSDLGSRRSAFSAHGVGGSGRGSRMGLLGTSTRSGDLDSSGSENLPERWRSRRNFSTVNHRSSRNSVDEWGGGGAGDGGGGGDRDLWRSRRTISSANERGVMSRMSAWSARGDSFLTQGSSVRREDVGVGGGGGAGMMTGRRAEISTATPSHQQQKQQQAPSNVASLFSSKPSGAIAGVVNPGSTRNVASTARRQSAPDDGSDGSPSSSRRVRGLSRSPAAVGAVVEACREGRASLRRECGRFMTLGSATDDVGAGGGGGGAEGDAAAEREEPAASPCRRRHSSTERTAPFGSVAVSKDDEVVCASAARSTTDCRTAAPSVTPAPASTTVDDVPMGNCEGCGSGGIVDGGEHGCEDLPEVTRMMEVTPTNRDEGEGRIEGGGRPGGGSTIAGGMGVGRSLGDAPCPQRWKFRRVITEDNEQAPSMTCPLGSSSRLEVARGGDGDSSDHNNDPGRDAESGISKKVGERVERTVIGAVALSVAAPSAERRVEVANNNDQGNRRSENILRRDKTLERLLESESSDAVVGDVGVVGASAGDSPEVSPSAAPANRKQPLFSSSYRSSLLLGREDGKSGSGMSTWSTNSPSPVLTNDGVGGIADDVAEGED